MQAHFTYCSFAYVFTNITIVWGCGITSFGLLGVGHWLLAGGDVNYSGCDGIACGLELVVFIDASIFFFNKFSIHSLNRISWQRNTIVTKLRGYFHTQNYKNKMANLWWLMLQFFNEKYNQSSEMEDKRKSELHLHVLQYEAQFLVSLSLWILWSSPLRYYLKFINATPTLLAQKIRKYNKNHWILTVDSTIFMAQSRKHWVASFSSKLSSTLQTKNAHHSFN